MTGNITVLSDYAEASHRRLQSELGVQHPNIWRFIDGFRKVQNSRDKNYESMIAGQTPARKRRRYRNAEERIFNLLNQFNGNASTPPQTMWEFLSGTALNFSMDKLITFFINYYYLPVFATCILSNKCVYTYSNLQCFLRLREKAKTEICCN